VPVAPAPPAPGDGVAAVPPPELFAENAPSMAVNPPPLLPPTQLGGPQAPVFAGPYGAPAATGEGGT